MKDNLSYCTEELGCAARIRSGCLAPCCQPQRSTQKVESRV